MPVWLTSRLAGPIAAGLALLLLLATGTLGFRLWLADRDLSATTARAVSAERDLGQARANSLTLEASIATTNAKLNEMAADALARDQARVAADKKIDATLGRTMSALATAKPGADKCASASDLIRKFAK